MEISEEKLQEYCYKFINNRNIYIYDNDSFKSILEEVLQDHEKIVRKQVIKELSKRNSKIVNHNTKRK